LTNFIVYQCFVRIASTFRCILIAIFVPLFFISSETEAQQRVKAPVKFKIEDGGFEETTVVIKNNTSGESNSIPGASKFDLDLKMNSDYIISFMKPGYITKRIAFNTKAPVERVNQGFYPFTFEVNLFKQYDGVNIVVFNQPVGKIEYSRLIDDFDYDTDYTKQIQSALKQAEEEIRKKQAEEKALAEQTKKEEEKKKAEDTAKAREELKAKQEADKKAAAEARVQAVEDAKRKKIEEEDQRKNARAAAEEEKRQLALAKMEEEERARLKAVEDEEARRKAQATSGEDPDNTRKSASSGSESRTSASVGGGNEEPVITAQTESGQPATSAKASKGSGEEVSPIRDASYDSGSDKNRIKAQSTSGSDVKTSSAAEIEKQSAAAIKTTQASSSTGNDKVERFEVLPERSVEEIVETNRKLTKVTVRKGEKETVFSKVVYNWGGVYYFRATMSISESLYFLNTGLR